MNKISKHFKRRVPGQAILEPEAKGAPGLSESKSSMFFKYISSFIVFSTERTALFDNFSGPSASLKQFLIKLTKLK